MLTILYFVFFWTSSASINIHSFSLYSRLITFINHNHSELNLHKAKSVNELHYTLYTVLLDDNFLSWQGHGITWSWILDAFICTSILVTTTMLRCSRWRNTGTLCILKPIEYCEAEPDSSTPNLAWSVNGGKCHSRRLVSCSFRNLWHGFPCLSFVLFLLYLFVSSCSIKGVVKVNVQLWADEELRLCHELWSN